MFASALSLHPVPATAVGEVVGQLLDQGVDEPDLLVLFAAVAHTGALEDVVGAVRALVRPRTLLGCTTGTVVGAAREIEDRPALSLWAASTASVLPFRLSTGPGGKLAGLPVAHDLPGDAEVVLLLGDPFTFPVDAALERLRAGGIGLAVAGGLASAAGVPGGNRLVLDGELHRDGAVGVVLGGVKATTVVSQGCRPIGEPMAVTSGGGQLVGELAGRPALERLESTLRRLSPDDLELARRGLLVGRAVDESKVDYAPGDFLVRQVIGGDREAGAVAVGDAVEVGSTLQFQVRDAKAATEELRALLSGRSADAALVFTCNGRGTAMFGVPDHDAGVVAEALADPAVAGMSCAGELGPVGGRSFLHSFTASVVLFTDV